MKLINNIPKIWKRAYVLICLWYAINFAISTFFEWKLKRPFTYVLWNGLYLWEALCILIVLIFLWAHWLFRFRPVLQIVGHAMGIVSFFMIMGSLSYYFTDYVDGLVYFDNWKEFMIGLLNWEALRFYDQYIITVGVYYVIRYFQGLQKEEKEKSELALKNKEMQISLLKSQINPHFLFNTLNNIYSLAVTKNENTAASILKLSNIMRYVTDEIRADYVSLQNEADCIRDYIDLQRMRLGKNTNVNFNVSGNTENKTIAPLLLLTFVENVFKYGISNREQSEITIRLAVEEHSITFYSRNRLFEARPATERTGIGIANARQRLEHLYRDKYFLNINKDDGFFTVQLTLQV